MAKGQAKVNYLGRSGIVTPQTTPSWGFIYKASTVIDPRYYPGDRVVLPDGSEYTYAKSNGRCHGCEACQFDNSGVIAYITATAVAVGESKLTVPAQTHAAAIAKDELRGGFLSVFGDATDDRDHMFRRIIGNDASAINAAVKIYLDGPIDTAIDSNSAIEVFENPWMKVSADATGNDGGGDASGGNVTKGKAGVAAVYVSARDMYFWVQNTGPRFVTPQSGVVGNMTGVYWRHDGSLDPEIATASKDVNAESSQYAGHIMMGNYSGNGPIIWLGN